MSWKEEIGFGLALLALGVAFFVGFPPPGWPEMPHFLVRIAMCFGVALFVAGTILTTVGACRNRGARWPAELVKRWDDMWTKRFIAIAAPLAVAAIISAAWIWNALAQSIVPVSPLTPSPNNMISPNSGGGAIIQGSPNLGSCNALGAHSSSCNNYGPPRRERDVGQDGRIIGSIMEAHQESGTNNVFVSNLTIIGDFDTSAPIDLQGRLLSCENLKAKVNSHNPGRRISFGGEIKCTIIGRAN